MVSTETQSKIAIWRQRAREGTLTKEEMREALQALAEDRVRAAGASSTSRTKKAAKAAVNSDDLLGELDKL